MSWWVGNQDSGMYCSTFLQTLRHCHRVLDFSLACEGVECFFLLYLTARSQEADGGTDWVGFPINLHLLISGLLQKEYVLLPAWFADRRGNWRKQRIVSLWFCKKRGWQARKRIIEVEEGKDIWESGMSAWGYSGYWDKSVRK